MRSLGKLKSLNFGGEKREAVCGSVLVLLLNLEVHHLVNLLGRVAKESLEVTDEPVDIPLARSLEDDILIVVIPARRRKKEV